jgi:hypothetical protein
MPAEWWAFHHDVAGALEVSDEPLCHDVRHKCVRVMLALPAPELEREGERRGKFVGIGGSKLCFGVGHPRMMQAGERIKNAIDPRALRSLLRELKKGPTPGCGHARGKPAGTFWGFHTTRRLWYNDLTRPYCQLPQ